MNRLFFWFLLGCIIQLPITNCYSIQVDANEEQCFFDTLVKNSKMGLMFEVSRGGFLDIDIKVY